MAHVATDKSPQGADHVAHGRADSPRLSVLAPVVGDSSLEKLTYWLLLAMSFAIPWENVVAVEGLGTISRMVGLALAGLWILQVLMTGGMRRIVGFHWWLVLFVFWLSATYLWSADTARTSSRMQTYLQLMVFVLILWDVVRTERRLRNVMQAYVLGAYVSVYQMLVNFRSAGSRAGEERLTIEGFNTNDVAAILTLGMPMAWYLTLPDAVAPRTHIIYKILNYTYVPLAALSVLLTASRGATACMLLAFAYILVSLAKLRRATRLSIIGLMWLAGLAVIPLVPETSIERLSATHSEVASGDMNGRGDIWREAIELWTTHPIRGVGSGAFKAAAVEAASAPHNFVFSLSVETGLVGLGLFLGVLGSAALSAWSQPKWLKRLWLIELCIWGLTALTHNWEWRKQTWFFLGLIVVSGALPENEAERDLENLFEGTGV